MSELWQRCLARLQAELSAEEVQTWLAPLHASESIAGLHLLAPNAYTVDAVRERYLDTISAVLAHATGRNVDVRIEVGTAGSRRAVVNAGASAAAPTPGNGTGRRSANSDVAALDPSYTFETFVEGKSNQLGKAAALQVAMNPGTAYNPLLLYGGTGLGKTHLMHAAGNLMRRNDPGVRVLYLRSEQFVSAMVKALAQKNMDDFKSHYRSVDALLIDDIQFFAGKNTTQEEFFHTFNALFDGKQQIILTCDRYPKEVENLEPRLKSRLGWGLSVAIEPPDFETRAAILLSKAQAKGVDLPVEVAQLMAKRMRSNVRDLEGALNTLVARSNFERRAITPDFAQESLRDLLTVHAQAITVPNIQKTVADYYQLRMSDLLSPKRSRSVARPRQMAMALAKELTEHSLPELGDAFGGRDHTTVLHAVRKIAAERQKNTELNQQLHVLEQTLKG